jgi:phage terminase large subunit-like protein
VARQRKSVVDLIRDGTFRASQDEQLLNQRDPFPWPKLEAVRQQFMDARADPELAREISLELQRASRSPDGADLIFGNLERELRRLGRPGSFAQLERFAPTYFRHFAGARARQPFTFDPFQRRFLKEFWRRDRFSRRIYNFGLLGIPKGNGKTPLSAVVGTHALVTAPDEMAEVYVIAGAKDQARICHTFAKNNIRLGPLAAWLHAAALISYPSTLGEFGILSSDGDLAAGTNPSAAIVDEWWLFLHRKQREGFLELKEALHKRGGWSFLLAITTAGWTKDSQLGEHFDEAIAHSQLRVKNDGYLLELADRETGFLMHWYGLPPDAGDEYDIENPELVRACNPAPWISAEGLVRDLKQPGTDEYAWRRLHLNEWTKTKGVWLPTGAWAKLRAEFEIPAGAEVYVGVDVAHSYDTTAVAWAWRTPAGRIVVRCKIWSRRAEAPAHEHVDDFYDENAVHVAEKFILDELGEQFKVREVVADPNYFGTELRRIGRRFTTAPLFPQSNEMTESVQEFYRLVDSDSGMLVHNGDRILALHLGNIGGQKDANGYWRIRKLNDPNPMDGGTATIIAIGRVLVAAKFSKPWAEKW